MKLDQVKFREHGNGDSQADRMLDALKQWPAGEWCPMPHLARVASEDNKGTGICVARRIYDLRSALDRAGFKIVNRKQYKDGQCLSWYRIVRKTKLRASASPR